MYQDRPIPASEQAYLKDLTDAWFNQRAFIHVFCGEIDRNSIGGMHFGGRFLDLQQKGLAERLPNNREEAIPGVVYQFGARVKVGDRFVEHRIKSYAYTMSAEDILSYGTRIFANNSTSTGAESFACNVEITDDGKTFQSVYVWKSNGIRTFYPDASPAQNMRTCRY